MREIPRACVYPVEIVRQANLDIIMEGHRDLPIFKGSQAQAIAEARKKAKYLITFLHSPSHPDSIHFTKEILPAAASVDLLKNDFLIWIGSVQEEEGYRLSWSLNATTFPCIVMQLKSEVCLHLQGHFTLGDFLHNIQVAMAATETIRAEEITWVHDRESRERLREMQERELAEAERIDFERQQEQRRKAQEESERKAKEEAERQAAERAAAAEADRKRREEEERRLEEERRQREAEEKKALAMSLLPSEEESIKGVSPDQLAAIKLVSLNGAAHERKFPVSAPLDHLYAYAELQEEYDGRKYYLAAGFPPKRLPRGDGTSIADQGRVLCPRAVVTMREEIA